MLNNRIHRRCFLAGSLATTFMGRSVVFSKAVEVDDFFTPTVPDISQLRHTAGS